MKEDLFLYHIDKKLIRNFHNADDNVMSVSPQIGKETRPFIGIVVLLNKRQYCIPLTSPNKAKFAGKSKIDFIKICDKRVINENGAYKTIGILNINNMVPVDKSVLTKIDLTLHKTDLPDKFRRKNLMLDQLDWCRNNYAIIENRANKVYSIVTKTPEKNKNLVYRCCNFLKLESVLDKYINPRKNDSKIPNNDKWFMKVNSKQAEQLRTAGISFDGKVFTDKESVIKINIQDKDKALSLLNSKNIRK